MMARALECLAVCRVPSGEQLLGAVPVRTTAVGCAHTTQQQAAA